MRARRVASVSIFLALIGVAVWLAQAKLGAGRVDPRAVPGPAPGSSAQGSPAPPERSDPLLRPGPGTSPAASASAPPREASRLLRVCARSAVGGVPPPAAQAYVAPKQVALREKETRVAPLDEQGCATFPRLDPRECWIGVRAEGHVAAVVDGDAWDGQDVQLTLAPARVIEVEIRSADGALPPGTWLALTPPGPRTGNEWPGRGEREDFWISARVEQVGTISFAPPTNGSVELALHAPGCYAVEGDTQVVPSQRARGTFTLEPACRIRLDVIDAESRQSLAYDAEVRVLEAAGGGLVSRQAASLHSPAADWKSRGLRPGEYALEIRAPGYLPVERSPVRLERPGAVVEYEVPLQPHPAAGRVLLHLDVHHDGDEPAALPATPLHVQGRFLGAQRPGWEALAVGEHDLMVWAGPRLVGRALVRVLGRRTDTARVRLQPGLLIDFAHCPLGFRSEEVVAEGEAPRGGSYLVTLRDLDGVELPEIRWRSLQSLTGPPPAAAADGFEERGEITPWTVLGPFPCAEVQVYDAITEESVWRVRRR